MAANAHVPSRRRYMPHAIWAAMVIVPFLFVLVSVFQTEIGPGECRHRMGFRTLGSGRGRDCPHLPRDSRSRRSACGASGDRSRSMAARAIIRGSTELAPLDPP